MLVFDNNLEDLAMADLSFILANLFAMNADTTSEILSINYVDKLLFALSDKRWFVIDNVI